MTTQSLTIDLPQSVVEQIAAQAETKAVTAVLNSIADQFGLAVVQKPQNAPARKLLTHTPKVDATIPWKAYLDVARKYRKHSGTLNPITKEQIAIRKEIVRTGTILMEEYGVSKAELGRRVGRHTSWFYSLEVQFV